MEVLYVKETQEVYHYLIEVTLTVNAGVAFLREVPEGTYDAIIVDSSDPVGKSRFLDYANGIIAMVLASKSRQL